MGHDGTTDGTTEGSDADGGGTGEPAPAPAPAPAPVEERELDPRAIARASLAASRNASLWWVAVGVAIAAGTSIVASTVAGTLVLVALLVAGAGVRAFMPPPGPAAFVVRAKTLDVAVLLALALALGFLSQIIPAR